MFYVPFLLPNARPNSHLPAREAPKDQNKHVQIRASTPSSVSSKQEQTYTNSHPPRGRHPSGGPSSQRGVQIREGLEPAAFFHSSELLSPKVSDLDGCFSSEKPYHDQGDSLLWTGPQWAVAERAFLRESEQF